MNRLYLAMGMFDGDRQPESPIGVGYPIYIELSPFQIPIVNIIAIRIIFPIQRVHHNYRYRFHAFELKIEIRMP